MCLNTVNCMICFITVALWGSRLDQLWLRLQQRFDRKGQDHGVAVAEAGGIATDFVHQPPLHGTSRCAVAMHKPGDRHTLLTKVESDRATDQTEANHTNFSESLQPSAPLLAHAYPAKATMLLHLSTKQAWSG